MIQGFWWKTQSLSVQIIFQLLGKIQLKITNKNKIKKSKDTIVKPPINSTVTENSPLMNYAQKIIHHEENTPRIHITPATMIFKVIESRIDKFATQRIHQEIGIFNSQKENFLFNSKNNITLLNNYKV